ncbi:unnamed protein product [Protopolystoma xenopodis]|uniref:Uncharacterized protein n=1 Tax=Protopolystoma xenopodis TaxID=117903 RepID=A0A448XIM0_9PLAT|nr:unnamed protein product [Protopolystoma xenopodis]
MALCYAVRQLKLAGTKRSFFQPELGAVASAKCDSEKPWPAAPWPTRHRLQAVWLSFPLPRARRAVAIHWACSKSAAQRLWYLHFEITWIGGRPGDAIRGQHKS